MFNQVHMFPLFKDISSLNLFLDHLEIQQPVDEGSVEDSHNSEPSLEKEDGTIRRRMQVPYRQLAVYQSNDTILSDRFNSSLHFVLLRAMREENTNRAQPLVSGYTHLYGRMLPIVPRHANMCGGKRKLCCRLSRRQLE